MHTNVCLSIRIYNIQLDHVSQVGAAGIRLDSLEGRVDVLEVSAVEQSKNIPVQLGEDGGKIPKLPSFVSIAGFMNKFIRSLRLILVRIITVT